MILEEARRNVVEKAHVDESASHRLMDSMSRAFPEARVDGYEPLIAAMTNDEKDRHVVAAAVRCHAQVIVTANLKDFPEHALEPYGLEAQHPDEFLCYLFDLDPGRVLQVVVEQAADLRKPPRTVLEVVEGLGRVVPEFAELVRGALPRAMTAPT